MTTTGYRKLCLILGVVCCVQTWRACHRGGVQAPAVECPEAEVSRPTSSTSSWDDDRPARSRERTSRKSEAAASNGGGFTIHGFTIPSWALRLAPQWGEDLRSYRDRMLPLAQMAVAPHRARVARSRDDLAKVIGLDGRQRAELDAAVAETATAIQDRVFEAALGGEFSPSTFKPMTGVGVAKDLIDAVDRGNRRFLASLSDDQRARLAAHPFDFADYLVFSARWEDAISGL